MIIVLPVFREEGWHSMDLCVDMLVKNAPAGTELEASLPKYRKLVGFLPSKKAINFDRWYNRWKVYPEHLKKLTYLNGFFHIVDHSYAHLANYLPEGKVGIYCHDLDAFRCILEPEKEKRPFWFRRMMGNVFEGFKKARIVFCNTHSTRNSVLNLGIWKEDQVIHTPLGVAEDFCPNGERDYGEYLLHVGSCIPRKRIDILLKGFAEISKRHSNLRLVQAGGTFTKDQKGLIGQLRIASKVEQRRNLSRNELASLYRGAKCLLVTSEVEGFGLPVIEALSCGTMVVASDIPALREVGESLVSYFSVGDSDHCAEVVLNLLEYPKSIIQDVGWRWSWANHARSICRAYDSLGSKR